MCEFSEASIGDAADVVSDASEAVADIGDVSVDSGEAFDSFEGLDESADFDSDLSEGIEGTDDFEGLDESAIEECALDAETVDQDCSETTDVDDAEVDAEDPTTDDLESFDDVAEEEPIDMDEAMADEPAPTLSEVMDDPTFFETHGAGEYSYDESELGKNAHGILELADEPIRDANAQRQAGGMDRRPDDDGGHLIGARFGGAPTEENLDAQNRNLNRGAYKSEENSWAEALQESAKVYANIDTYKREGTERPDAYMGWTVTESPDGQRHWDAFSYTNESAETQDQWARELEELPDTDDVPNAMVDENYDTLHEYIDGEE